MPPRGSEHAVVDRHFGFPESAWPDIEAAYGRSLPGPVRKRINAVTADFVDMAFPQKSSASPLPAKRRLERLRALAVPFLEELDKRKTLPADAAEFYYADSLIDSISRNRRVTGGLLVEPFAADLARFIALIKAAQRLLRSWRKRSSWNDWIADLTAIAKSHGLPWRAAVTEKKDKPEQHSPFVHLVYALQGHVPAGIRHSTQSLTALTESIKRARRPQTGTQRAKNRADSVP
jgi:hypothetical protein